MKNVPASKSWWMSTAILLQYSWWTYNWLGSLFLNFSRNLCYVRKVFQSVCRFFSPMICHFWLRQPRKHPKERWFAQNITPRHPECSFDNSAENCALKVRIFLLQFQKKTLIFHFKTVFFSQNVSSSGHVECSFDNTGQKFFAQTPKNVLNLFFFLKKTP